MNSLQFIIDAIHSYNDTWNLWDTIVVVKDNLTIEDILKYKNHWKDNVYFITPKKYNDGAVSYTIISINSSYNWIRYANTNGDILDEQNFNALCNLKHNGRYFHVNLSFAKTKKYHEFFLLHIYTLFVNYPKHVNLISEEKNELDYINNDMWLHLDDNAKDEDPQPLTSYESLLKNYKDMDHKIRRVIENHVKFIKEHETSQVVEIDNKTQIITKQW